MSCRTKSLLFYKTWWILTSLTLIRMGCWRYIVCVFVPAFLRLWVCTCVGLTYRPCETTDCESWGPKTNMNVYAYIEWKQYYLIYDAIHLSNLAEKIKTLPDSINIWEIVHKGAQLYSAYPAPSHGPNLTLLVPLSAELVYLSMLFILEMTAQAISNIDNMLK